MKHLEVEGQLEHRKRLFFIVCFLEMQEPLQTEVYNDRQDLGAVQSADKSKLLIIDFSVFLTLSNTDTNLSYFIPKYGLTSIYLNVSTEIEKADTRGKDLISFPLEASGIYLSDLLWWFLLLGRMLLKRLTFVIIFWSYILYFYQKLMNSKSL